MGSEIKIVQRLLVFTFLYIVTFSNGRSQGPLFINNSVLIGANTGGFTGTLHGGDKFGNRTAVIGDVDNDGFDDIAVGAPNDDVDGTDAGAVWINFMKSNGTVKGQQKITLKGINGIVGDIFGAEIESIGDFNKDGIPDIAVFDRRGGIGAVFFIFLNTNGTVKGKKEISNTSGNWTPNLESFGNFGWGIENMGDIDGDGIMDLAVGAPYEDDGGTDFGSIYLIYLKSDGTVKNYKKISNTQGGYTGPFAMSDLFGVSLSNIGDLDKDGVTDLATGIFADDGGTNRGGVVILFLNSNGTVKSYQRISSTSGNFTGQLDDSDLFGFELLYIGDADKDGYVELLVNALNDDDGGTDRGAIWQLSLNPDGTVYSNKKISSTTGNNNKIQLNDGDSFGTGMGLFTDLNKDSYPDLVVGMARKDLGGTDVGALYILNLMDTCSVNNDKPNAGADTTIRQGQSITLSGCCGVTYSWTPNLYLSNSNIQNPIANPVEDVTYVLTVTNSNRCISTATINIKIKHDLFIPQLFSPNQDGNNDVFKVYGEGVKKLELSIYNNWGQRVYQSSNMDEIMNEGWNGIYEGVDQPQGSYVWRIEGTFLDGSALTFNGKKTGNFVLIR